MDLYSLKSNSNNMSSFLMNSGSYMDSKFLTGDDYSQPNYAHHSPADYYSQQAAAAMQYPNYPGMNSHHAANMAAAAYSRGDPMGAYSTYYQQCGMSPHQMQMATVGHLSGSSPLNCSPVSAASHLQQPPMSARSDNYPYPAPYMTTKIIWAARRAQCLRFLQCHNS